MSHHAAIYARVSTDEQAEKGYSLSHQLSECRRYAESNGFMVIYEATDDFSGAVIDRPGFSALRKFMSINRVDVIIVYTADRLSRNIVDFLVLREQWEKAAVELHYVDRGRSQNNFEGLLTDGIFALLAHGERLKIIERTTQGRYSKAKNNRLVMSGQPPYGYKKVGVGRDAEYELDPLEAEIVKSIFEWYVNGHEQYGNLSLRGISDLLDSMKINPPGNRKKAAPYWHPRTVNWILGNSIYSGIAHYGKLKNVDGKRISRPKHEWIEIKVPQLALVSREVFELAQKRAQRNREISRRNRKRDYLLTGHFRCGNCGFSMFGYIKYPATTLDRGYYRCSAESHKGNNCGNLKKQLPILMVDHAVWDWIESILIDEDNLDDGIREMLANRESQLGPRQERLGTVKELISKVDTKINRLVDELSQYDGVTVIAAIREKINGLENERKFLIEEAEKLTSELCHNDFSPSIEAEIKRMARRIRDKLTDTTLENKRRILEVLEVEVRYNFDQERGYVLNVSCSIPGTEDQIEFSTSPRLLPRPCNSSTARKRKSRY